MNLSKSRLIRFVCWMCLSFLVLGAMTSHSIARVVLTSTQATLQVSGSGDDGTCGRDSGVCRTIQRAVDLAVSGDTIQVAAGTYTAASGDSVVSVTSKNLILIGAGAEGDNVSIIDGGRVRRCVSVYLVDNFAMEGFVIQNGYFDQGISNDLNVFGGGMLVTRSRVNLTDLLFQNNVVLGEANGSGRGGSGSGGGLTIRESSIASTLTNLVFTNNEARGGSGSTRGGYSLGGGLFVLQAVVNGSNLEFTNNRAVGGNASGSGEDWGKADALGGAVSLQADSQVVLEDVIAHNNVATGGNAVQYAGGAFGGAFFTEGQPDEPTSLTLRGASVYDNQAVGGNASNGNGGHAAGGGGQFAKSSVTFDRVRVYNNAALGGNGTLENGPAGGGGLYFQNLPGASVAVALVNTIVADNLVRLGTGTVNQGGGGGGLWVQCMNNMQLLHTTIANNHLQVQGQPLGWVQGYAIVVGNDGCSATPSDVRIDYGMITGHDGTALHVKENNTARLQYTLWNNVRNTNAGDGQSGVIEETYTISQSGNPGYVSPEAPNYDYRISKDSDARDAAVGSPVTVDVDGEQRDAVPDVGADEFTSALVLSAAARNSTALNLVWRADTSRLPGVDHYLIVYTYEDGANPPAEGASPINAAMVTTYQLTGLSIYKKYTLRVEAYAGATLLDTSNTVIAFPTDIFVYFPLLNNEN